MDSGTLTIFSASAGSGKTHKLTGIYLERLFRSHFSYRKILAVTFTHKATAEMKGRILSELDGLSSGKASKYLDDLMRSTGKNEEELRREAGAILYSILHDYSRFSVSTIDSFYQKIIRAFTREIGIHSGFSIEIDHTAVIESAVENVISSVATDKSVRNWLTSFVMSNLDEGRSWDLKKQIIGLSGELFNEKFKLLPDEEKKKLRDKDFLNDYIKELKDITSSFRKRMREYGMRCIELFDKNGLSDEMFYYKGKGVPGYIRSVAGGDIRLPNTYVRAALQEPPRWSSGRPDPALEKALEGGLADTVREMIAFYDKNLRNYRSAGVILSNIYILGILSDVLNEVQSIARDENIFFLPDAGELIYLITAKDQAPFIYEKVGNVFENFMIDEFQDTSVIQWKNFRLLIENSMAQGYDNLVVGDIKQSIYRWRNSDWNTLRELRDSVDGKRLFASPLDTNYRSSEGIIRFNNTLFSIIPALLDSEVSGTSQSFSFRGLYSEVVQKDPGRKEGGYVRIEFIENNEDGTWQESVIGKLPLLIESLQDKDYSASDIGILVRDNKEGSVVLRRIIDYSMKSPAEKKEKYNYSIISGDSLLLSNSPPVNFIISLFRVIDNPSDTISKALMIRYYLLATGYEGADSVFLPAEELDSIAEKYFPEGFSSFIDDIRFRTIWDIAEQSAGFFALGEIRSNVAFLNAFQDLVINHTSARNPSVSSFLDWWEKEGVKKSIILPGNQDAMQVLTIHKSKGLEFKVVILPFLSWNLDHKPFHTNIMWTSPLVPPFNALGVVPLKYRSELENTIFEEEYFREKYSAYLDNINLLYVAFTRAENVIAGFAPAKPAAVNRIAALLKEAVTTCNSNDPKVNALMSGNFDVENQVFEFGEIPSGISKDTNSKLIRVTRYPVNTSKSLLKLKFHWENYFSADKEGKRARISHGKLMHEIFGEIFTAEDVKSSVRRRVVEGKIQACDEDEFTERITRLITKDEVRSWFEAGNLVLNEASVLMPDASMRRPDRIIFRDGAATLIDFKFGEESLSHVTQMKRYKSILGDMGYVVRDAFLWYVESDKLVIV